MNLRPSGFHTRIFTGLFLVLALPFLASCGKSGMPQPNDPSRNFSWDAVQAVPYEKCLSFSGQLGGAYQNLDRIRVELASVNGPEDCPGCPFVPKEEILFTPKEAGFNINDGTVAFSYCPTPAKAYRWRMSGISKYSRVPNAVSYEQMTVIEPF